MEKHVRGFTSANRRAGKSREVMCRMRTVVNSQEEELPTAGTGESQCSRDWGRIQVTGGRALPQCGTVQSRDPGRTSEMT